MEAMETEQQGTPQVSGFERHIQTALAVVITMLLGWMGNTVSESSQQIARLEERMLAMSAKLDDLNGMQVSVKALEVRVDVIERRMGEWK